MVCRLESLLLNHKYQREVEVNPLTLLYHSHQKKVELYPGIPALGVPCGVVEQAGPFPAETIKVYPAW